LWISPGWGLLLLLLAGASALVAQERRYTIAFANLTEEPGVTLEGTGFTGREVRESFALAARRHPIDLVFYDNQRDPKKALANVEEAIGRKVHLYIQYCDDPVTNARVGERLRAAKNDASALAAKSALDSAGRLHDGAIVGQGVDRSVHGGINDRKEIDPANRGSIVLGSVAFYLDRYGYDVLPIAMRMLRGEAVATRTVTAHRLITAANVFIEYPPNDMN